MARRSSSSRTSRIADDDLASLTVRQLEAELTNQGAVVSRVGLKAPTPKELTDILVRTGSTRFTYPVAAALLAARTNVITTQTYSLAMFDDLTASYIPAFMKAYGMSADPPITHNGLIYLILTLSYSGLINERDRTIIEDDSFIPLYTLTDDQLRIEAVKRRITTTETPFKRSDLVRVIVMSQRTTFPYEKLTMDPAAIMFRRLQEYVPTASTDKYYLVGYRSKTRFDPKINLELSGVSSLDGIYLSIRSSEAMVRKFDGISDHFTEEVRMKAKLDHKPWSPYEFWTKNQAWIEGRVRQANVGQSGIKPDAVDSTSSRTLSIASSSSAASSSSSVGGKVGPLDVIWANTQWATRFKPSWVKFLILVMFPSPAGKKYLDISAGWGDRLITAMSLNMDYLGVDPNTNLKPGHDQMIAKFGDSQRHRIIYQPFESDFHRVQDTPGSQLEVEFHLEPVYDLVLSSPPFFNLEKYSDQNTQSIERFPRFETWVSGFLLPSLTKAWMALKPGGIMMIHLSDSRFYQAIDSMHIHVNTLPGVQYVGVLGVAGERGKYRPVWVWRKSS